MNIKKILFVFVIVSIYLSNPNTSQATVGGPEYISNIQGKNGSTEIIYEINSYSGRGCRPTIVTEDTVTGIKKILLPCDKSEKLSDNDFLIEEEVLLSGYPTVLDRIDLNKNKITAVITSAIEEKYDPSNGKFGKTDFDVDIYQDGVRKTSIKYQGCKPDQSHVINGYRMLNNKSIVLVVSTIGDCFEGGYTEQRIFVVKDINIFDSKPLPIVNNAEAIIDGGSLTMDYKDKVVNNEQVSTEVKVDNKNSNVSFYQITIILLVLIVLALVVSRRK